MVERAKRKCKRLSITFLHCDIVFHCDAKIQMIFLRIMRMLCGFCYEAYRIYPKYSDTLPYMF